MAVRWSQTDTAIVSEWSRAIGAAVSAAISAPADGGDRGVLRYPSRSHAMIDLVVRCLTGDRSRAWAWRQLGLWPERIPLDVSPSATTPALPSVAGNILDEVVVEHLRRAPTLIVPAFVRLSQEGRLAAAVSALGSANLVDLAGLAWRTAGGHSGVTAAVRAASEPATAAVSSGVPALLSRSRIAAAVAAGPGYAPDVTVACAALAVVESEPSAARTARDPLALVAEAVRLLEGGGRRQALPAGQAQAATDPVPTAGPDAGATASETDEAREAGAERGTAPARTAWGGLMFLLHVVDDLDMPARLAANHAVATAGLRTALHALGTALLTRAAGPRETVAPTDPALLAFCGLAPDAEPPAPPAGAGDEVTAALARAVNRESAAVAVEVARRVPAPAHGSTRGAEPAAGETGIAPAGPRWPEPSSADTTLAFVCRRPAGIVVDPGWIDVVFSLDEVCTDVRRAGLDLDLGYLSWLGCVVRFRYV